MHVDVMTSNRTKKDSIFEMGRINNCLYAQFAIISDEMSYT